MLAAPHKARETGKAQKSIDIASKRSDAAYESLKYREGLLNVWLKAVPAHDQLVKIPTSRWLRSIQNALMATSEETGKAITKIECAL